MAKAKTALIKYIFLDIVGFTDNRSVEAQSDLIGCLNSLVTEVLEKHDLGAQQDILPRGKGRSIFIPTGDGICIALMDVGDNYEIHLQVALDILALIDKHNSETSDKMRKFEVRIGLNENVDNLVTDINGNENVAGMGINMAQRAMTKADGSQIIVCRATYEMLCAREQYMKSFRTYKAKGKHGQEFYVYQYSDDNKSGLNIEIPEVFVPPRPVTKSPPKLTKLAAYYLAQAIKNRQFFLSKVGDPCLEPVGTILLYFLAYDSEELASQGSYGHTWQRTWGSSTSIDKQYHFYIEMYPGDRLVGFVVQQTLAQCINELHLKEFKDCFEVGRSLPNYVFASTKGQERLKQEWPKIWEEFSLDKLQ